MKEIKEQIVIDNITLDFHRAFDCDYEIGTITRLEN